jgi:hypothetical protein
MTNIAHMRHTKVNKQETFFCNMTTKASKLGFFVLSPLYSLLCPGKSWLEKMIVHGFLSLDEYHISFVDQHLLQRSMNNIFT